MVASLDDYMNGKASNKQRKNNVLSLDDYMNNEAAQSNVVTPRITSTSQNHPAVSASVDKKVSVGEGLGNLGSAIGEGVGNFAQTVASNPIGFAKDTVNSLVVNPAKEFGTNVLNPDVTKSPWLAIGGGIAKGAVELPQNLWNLGVDAVNAYNNTPEQNQHKAHYVEDIANALQDNKLYQDMYQKPKQANETIAELSSFAAPMAVAGKINKTVDAIKTANKVAKESTRIASKLTDAQKAKYANQIQRLAQDNVAKGINPSSVNNVIGNTATGFGLGALEGDTLQDRIANGTGMAALGLALTGGHAAAQKAWNSKRGLEFRNNSAETLKNLTTDYDKVSQAVAGIDNALNTNLSKNASDLTKTRKEYIDKLSENQNYKRHISDEEKALLEDAGKLTDEQQTEIFERNKYGNRERALRISKDVKAELAKEQPETEQKHSTTTKPKKEADKWFEDIEKREQEQAKVNAEKEQADLEEFMKKMQDSKEAWEKQKQSQTEQKSQHVEDDLSHVKSETDINYPKEDETRLKNDSDMPEDNIVKFDEEGLEKLGKEMQDFLHPEKNYPKSGKAEGSDSSFWYEKKTSPKPKQLSDENMYENYEVEGTKPTTDAELMQEIEAAKKQKDVPVIRSADKFEPKTEAQIIEERNKMASDKLQNENARKAWINRLRNTKIKSLNDDTKTKSMLDIVFENPKNNKDTHYSIKFGKASFDRTKFVQTRAKTEVSTIGKCIKGEGKIEEILEPVKDVRVVLSKFSSLDGKQGQYNKTKNTITIYANCKEPIKTLLHECRHALQEKIADLSGRKLYRKIVNIGYERGARLMDFVDKNSKVLDKISPDMVEWKEGRITKEEFYSKITRSERKVADEYDKLYEKYRKCYTENDAIEFSNKNFDKKLFGKTPDEVSGLVRDKGTYTDRKSSPQEKNDNKLWGKRLHRNFDTSYDTERRFENKTTNGDIKNEHQGTNERGRIEEPNSEVSNDGGNGVGNERTSDSKDSNKLIHRTLNWFDKTKNKHTKFYHQFLEATPEIKRFTDAYKTIQDKREAFFREFGTYTDERMKARLFKQSKSGEGVYFQQGTKRNEKVDWGKESNTKAGFTGHKELEGISEKGTTQEGLARGFSDIVRMEHTRNCIQFLKDNFGKEQEGYIPVNSKLLANAMYFGKSKAWYETIRKGQEAIEKTFDEKNAKEWNELYRTTEADKSDIYLPKDLLDLSITGEKELPLDYLATYGKVLGTKGRVKGMAKVAGAMLDFYTDRFKRKVLTSASFFANNRFGNQIMLAMTADNPAEYIKGIANAFRLKESEVPTQILESTLAEAIQHEANTGIRKYFSEKNNTLDNIARILDGDEIASKSIAATASNWIISKPNALFRSLSKLTGEINERFERFERKQAYAQALSKMQKNKVLKTAKKFAGIHELAEVAKTDTLIREAVIDKVADVLGDYNNFNKFEKNFMKKLIPFYAWNRTITRHVINLAKDNPVKATLVAIETYRLLNQDDSLEDYQHGSLKTGLRNERTNSDVVINKASMIPYNTLFDMISGENIGSVSPLITKPLEAARGEKFFKPASEITSKNWKRTTQDKKQGYQNIKTGEFREGKAPVSVRAGYLAKDAMETVYPMAGSPMTKGLPDAVKHYNQTGEFLFPDKQYDANLGGFYDGDKAGKYKRGKKTYNRKLSAKNRLDFKYQVANRLLGLGIQPEHKVSKEQKEKYQQQRKRMRGY